MRLNRFAEAENYFRAALDEQPMSDATLYNCGIVLKALNRPAEALQSFDRALKLNPTVAETWNNRGTVWSDLKRYEEAIADFDKAIELNPRYAEAFCNRGKSLLALKWVGDAFVSYERALELRPDLAKSWLGCGNVFFERHEYNEALGAYDRATRLNPNLAEAWLGRGNTLFALKRHAESLAAHDKALALNSKLAEAWCGRGTVYFSLKQHSEAIAAFQRALAIKPELAEAWLGCGNVLTQADQNDEALAAYDQALKLVPEFAEARLGRGNVLNKLKRYKEAFTEFDEGLALRPDLAKAWLGKGDVHYEQQRYHDALGAFDRALRIEPELASAWARRGNAQFELGRHDHALAAYDKALRLQSDLAEAWLGRGNVNWAFKRSDDALIAYDKALALKPELAEAWLGRGNVYFELKQLDALPAYKKALAINPDLAKAWLGCGNALFFLQKHYEDAYAAYDKAFNIDPNLEFAAGSRLFTKLYICDWTNLEDEGAQLLSQIRNGKSASPPFELLPLQSSPADQLQCARCYLQRRPLFPPLGPSQTYNHDRVRVAYLSADFRDHPVAHLTAGLFEYHDQSRFEVTGISIGPRADSAMRRRIEAAFEHFVDGESKTDHEIANIIRDGEIDILIDLMGHTQGARLEILARRPSPVQVSYLGYAGTTGATYIDYIVADSTTIAEDQQTFYSEKVVWLPDSFLVNDNRRTISPNWPTRSACGLPERGFVFCSFNNSFKITPVIFEVWIRLLKGVPDSVLWLSTMNSPARANLLQEAERSGVSAQRIIFAPRVDDVSDHLARQGQADLFLDTLPYNAHSTACDALWAGLPVVTCLGQTFAGRVAASVLRSVGLPEMIATTVEDYEALALKLARDPSALSAIKVKLARHRDTHPLFDTARFTRHIEAAYITMWQHHRTGEPPRAFAVEIDLLIAIFVT